MTFFKLTTLTEEQIIEQTKNWIKTVVIDCNFCPFAAKVYSNKTIHYTVSTVSTIAEVLPVIKSGLELLDKNEQTETSFIIFPKGFNDFNDYLSLVKKAEKLLTKEDYEGIYQIASFHPDYCFEGSDNDDPANYTNRSVYPMLHMLREESIDKALQFFPHSEKIPENNIAFTREKGLKYMQLLLNACK